MTLDGRLARLERVIHPAPYRRSNPTWSDDDGRKFEDAVAAETARLTPDEREEWAAWYTCYTPREA